MTFWSQPEIKCGWPDLDEVHYEPASHFPSRTYIIHYTGLVLAIILRARLLLFWFSRERGVFCETVLFWLQTKPQNFQHHKNVCQEIAACNTEPLKHEPTFHDIWLPKYVVLIPSKHFLAKCTKLMSVPTNFKDFKRNMDTTWPHDKISKNTYQPQLHTKKVHGWLKHTGPLNTFLEKTIHPSTGRWSTC